jgi:hypothetical protein
MMYRDVAPPEQCTSCIAWYAEYQRASLLLERLAEDRFPDQSTFDEWMAKQMTQAFRPRRDGQ